VVFSVLIWWNARLLFLAEQERARAERRLAVQYAASRALAESATPKEAIQKTLQAFGETMDWPVGAMWQVDNLAGVARCVDTWQQVDPRLDAFTEACGKATLAKDAGLPGKAWGENRPVWTEEIRTEGGMAHGRAAVHAGLRMAFAFPVRCEQHTFGVMEFYSRSIVHPGRALLDLFDSTGNQVGQFIERKRGEEQLRQLTAELTRSNTELQQFAYIASHDLTEPLRMIRSYLELLSHRERESLDAESQEFVSYALDGAKRMQGLMADLLAYARVGSRGQPFEPTDCEAVLQGAMANLQLSITENDAVVEHEPLPTVLGDPFQLTQLFQNLIGNAIKFRGSAPPRIQISADRQESEWLFRVRDNGIGIEPRNYERIFVLFQRLHTRQEYPGTGMGLAICKKIVERHGGRLWVTSTQGEGSTFHFALPVMNGPGT
jgi:signal transduction histidine kinase